MSPGRRCTSTAGWPCSDGRARSGATPPRLRRGAIGQRRRACGGASGGGVRGGRPGSVREESSGGTVPRRFPGGETGATAGPARPRPDGTGRGGRHSRARRPLQPSLIPLPQPAAEKSGLAGYRSRRLRSDRIGRADRIRLASRRSAAATSACCPGARRAKRSAKRETRLSMPWKLDLDCGGIAAPARRNSAGVPAVPAPVALGPRCRLSARPRAAGESVCHASNLCYDPAEPAGRPGRSARERPFRAWAWGGGRPQAPRRGKDRRAAAPKRCEEDR